MRSSRQSWEGIMIQEGSLVELFLMKLSSKSAKAQWGGRRLPHCFNKGGCVKHILSYGMLVLAAWALMIAGHDFIHPFSVGLGLIVLLAIWGMNRELDYEDERLEQLHMAIFAMISGIGVLIGGATGVWIERSTATDWLFAMTGTILVVIGIGRLIHEITKE